MKGMVNIEFKKIEDVIVPIYESENKEKLINARELHQGLGNKRKFSDWIKQRIEKYKFVENQDFITFHKFVKRGENNLGTELIEYYVTVDMAKELCMVENNEKRRNILRNTIYKNTKNGKRGEIKEKGYKIENICYKIQ